MPDNCVEFDGTRLRAAQRREERAPASARSLDDLFSRLSPAQCAFLSGVLAVLSEHGEEALTKSCEMVLQRFGRGAAS